jgi:VWFA-related protein
LLDVVVKDRNGNIISNLDPSDFTIYEDGITQKQTSFDAPAQHHLPEVNRILVHGYGDLAKIGSAPVTILVLDELNTSFEDMAFARQKMDRYLNAQPAILAQPTSMLAVTNSRLQVIHDYTQDRDALRQSLKRHLPELPLKFTHSGANSSGAYERMASSLNLLHQIAASSSGTPGRKSVIWVGKGFPAVNLLLLDNDSITLMQNAIQRLTRELLDVRIALYTIDPAANLLTHGFVSSPEELSEFESRTDGQPFADEIKFSTFAPLTGGQAFYDRNDVDRELHEAVEQGTNYYSLSYAPSNNEETPGRYRHIRVALKNPDLIAVNRDGYYLVDTTGNAFDALENQDHKLRKELEAEMGSAALSQLPYNGVRASIEKNDGAVLTLIVAAGTLDWALKRDGKSQSEITALSVAFDAKGKVLAHNSKEMLAQVHGEVKDIDQKAVFLLHLLQPVGTARVRVVVRDANNGKIGTADFPVQH